MLCVVFCSRALVAVRWSLLVCCVLIACVACCALCVVLWLLFAVC